MVKQSNTQADRRGGDRRQDTDGHYSGPERRKSDRRTIGSDAPAPA